MEIIIGKDTDANNLGIGKYPILFSRGCTVSSATFDKIHPILYIKSISTAVLILYHNTII